MASRSATRRLLGAAALLAPTLLSAQEGTPETPPRDRFTETVEVTEVLLDLVVTDSRGNVVAGLGREAFVVEEGGRPMEVTSVTFHGHRPGLSAASGAPSSAPAEPLADRFFILFFHDDRPSNPRLARNLLDAGRWLERWIEEDLAPNDYVAVASYAASLRVWTDFTNDKPRIADAVRAVSLGPKAFEDRPTAERRRDPYLPSLLAGLPDGRELRRNTVRIHDALALVAEASRTIVGRKNLLLFSIGFGRAPEPGFPYWSPDARYYHRMVEALNDHNVAVYSIDLISSIEQGSLHDRGLNQSLSQLADDTGGRYYFHFNSFLQPLRDLGEATYGYYLLSYTRRVPADRPAGFRKVTVKTRPTGLRVLVRRGVRLPEP